MKNKTTRKRTKTSSRTTRSNVTIATILEAYQASFADDEEYEDRHFDVGRFFQAQ